MGKTRSLAEELTDLFNPAPTKEFDPDADVFGSEPVLEASDDELQAVPSKRRGKEGRRLVSDISLEGKEYSGRKASRQELFGDAELNGFAQQGDDDDDDASASDDEISEEETNESSSDEDDEISEEEFGAGKAAGGRKKRKSPSSSDDDENIVRGKKTRKGSGSRANDDNEMADLERELAQIQESEAVAAAGLKERAVKERQKALAVKAQKQAWNKALELRITLQKALQGGNKLPDPETRNNLIAADATVAEKYDKLHQQAATTVGGILDLLIATTERHPDMAQHTVANGTHDIDTDDDAPLSEQLWKKWDGAYQKFAPFRDASIDRWHRKTMLGSTAQRSNMKVLNQSVSSQVQALMKDSERLVQRSQLPMKQVAGQNEIQENGQAEDSDEEAIQDDRDPETYDDTEFYQTLLKEFLDSRSDAIGGNWYSGPKQRKKVDRRASKGRKLRYHVHEKLVNFMTPAELEAPNFAASIFANLFGGAKA